MRVKREVVRVHMEEFQDCEMGTRGNIQRHVPDCIMSLKSIGEGNSSAENLKEDYISQGIKRKAYSSIQFS